MNHRADSESKKLFERIKEKRTNRLLYQKRYRSDDYAKLHRQVWNQQHPNYYAQWQQRNPGYHRDYCRQWRDNNPMYTMNKNNEWLNGHPNYFNKYRIRNKRKMRKYWREYKRKVRAKTK